LLVGHTQFTQRLLERFNHFRWTTKMHASLCYVRHNAQQHCGGESTALPGPFDRRLLRQRNVDFEIGKGYRFRKFARRNRFSLFTAALVSGSLLLGTALSIWQAVRATAAESLAQGRLEDEKEARSDAEAARIEEAAQRHLADERRDEADKQRRRAEASFLLARKAVDEMYTEVAERWLNQLTLEPLQRDFIAKALRYYQEFAQVRDGNAAIRWEAVQASRRVGSITRRIEQSSEPTILAYRQASAILDDLAKEFPRESK
jgi:hypothetical protein